MLLAHNRLVKLFSSVLFILFVSVFHTAQARTANTFSCPVGQSFTQTFSSGAAWNVCWTTEKDVGLVINNASYKPSASAPFRQVIGEAYLSQIQTEYDDGSASRNWVTERGLGSTSIETMTSAMCNGGSIFNVNSKPSLCRIVENDDLIFRTEIRSNGVSTNQLVNGNRLSLYMVSKVDNHEYAVKWQFHETGEVKGDVGLTGLFTVETANNNQGTIAGSQNKQYANFVDHYFWHVDLDLGANSGDESLEEFRILNTADGLQKNRQTWLQLREYSSKIVPSEKRSWRIKDNVEKNDADQNISYEFVLLNNAQQVSHSSVNDDIYFTKYNACEKLALLNTVSGCNSTLSQFKNNENLNNADIVAWFRLSKHYEASDEDFSPIRTQWNGFSLIPRDWLSANQF